MPIVDSRIALPDSPAGVAAATTARRRAKTEAKESLAAAREAFLDSRTDALLSPADRDDPEKRDAARAVLRRAVDHAVLAADFPIEVESSPDCFEAVTVGRILDDRQGFHGRLTRDPLEPAYDGGRATGKLFLLDARPTLHSFAHGARTFRLIRAPDRIELVQGRTVEATEATIRSLRADPAVFDFGGQVALVEDGQMLPLDEHALSHYSVAQSSSGAGARPAAQLTRSMPIHHRSSSGRS